MVLASDIDSSSLKNYRFKPDAPLYSMLNFVGNDAILATEASGFRPIGLSIKSIYTLKLYTSLLSTNKSPLYISYLFKFEEVIIAPRFKYSIPRYFVAYLLFIVFNRYSTSIHLRLSLGKKPTKGDIIYG